jgi:hypothetical protein
MPAGTFIDKHIHDYDHISFLQRGVIILDRGEERLQFTGPTPILVRAGVKHRVSAITPVIWYCMHVTDEVDPEKIDEALKS